MPALTAHDELGRAELRLSARPLLCFRSYFWVGHTAFHAALCPFTCRMVSSVSLADHRIGSKAEQATASVATVPVIVAQPGRIRSGISSSTARIACLGDKVECMG